MDNQLVARRVSSIFRLQTELRDMTMGTSHENTEGLTFWGSVKTDVELAHVIVYKGDLVIRHQTTARQGKTGRTGWEEEALAAS